jgi:predicted PurR-regulated permease PerM
MEIKNYNTYFFIALLGGITLFSFLVIKPFLSAILVAAMLAVIFQRPYNFFLRITGDRKSISSLLTSLLVILVVIIPLFLLAGIILKEVNIFYSAFFAEGDFYAVYVQPTLELLDRNPLLQGANVKEMFSQKELLNSFGNISKGAFSIIQGIYQGMADFILWVFAMFFALYYFLIDGKRAIKRILHLSPLRDSHEEIIIQRFTSTIRAIFKGVLIVGLVQGTLGGLIFGIAGVQSPVIWGIVMFFFSLVPVIGTGLIWFPVGAFLLLIGNIWEGAFVLLAGSLLISTIDNFLRPKLVGRDTQMHPLLVFFATLGGLALFGVTGFILGPLVVAMCLTLWNIYALEFKDQLQGYNSGK